MTKYKFQAKILVTKNNIFLISEGRVELLKLVDKYGSIKKAAEDMQMSYRHAWGLINDINESLGENVVESIRGGSEGGRTALTKAGSDLITEFDLRKKSAEVIMKFGPRPNITVDGIIVKNNKILLIRRKNKPFKGQFALPGGFVEFKEPLEEAVVREMEEETGLKTKIKCLFGVYSTPDRDPRGHTISAIYDLEITGGRLRAGSDAKELKWFSFDKLPELGFDHDVIISDFQKTRRKK